MDLQTLIDRTYDGLRDAGREFIEPAEVIAWLNEAQRDLAHRQKVLQEEATVAADASGFFPMPPRLVDVITARVGTDDIRFVDNDMWWQAKDDLVSNPFNGPFGRVFGNLLEVHPQYTAGLEMKIRFHSEPEDMTDMTDVSPLPVELHPKMVYYARSMGFMRTNEVTHAQSFMDMYERGLEPPPLGRTRMQPGPNDLRYEPGPFDRDYGAMHRG